MSFVRVAVTGLGMISALGETVGESWVNTRSGLSALREITQVCTTGFRFCQGAEVRNFSPERHFSEKEGAFLDRFAQLGVVSAREAVAMAGPGWQPPDRHRTAVVTGSCVGGQNTQDEGFVALYREPQGRVAPLTIPRTMANAGASQISKEFGITGPSYTVSTACASANHAIGQAFWLVRHGIVDAAITGGSEAPFSPGLLRAWEAMRVVSPDTCRPFSKDRRGLILGEGGAMLVLERLDSAQARGATIYGEIVGFGMSADAHHLTQPLAEGASLAMLSALRDANLPAEAIGYINAHGTGTAANDATETAAIRQTFGHYADQLAVSSTKSLHGHGLGAAGAFEAVLTILALRHGILPPTVHYTTPDPLCDLDVIPNTARTASVEYALSNSFAFGGLNAVLAFRAWPA